MIFLIVYNRREERILQKRSFDESERKKAEDARLEVELELKRKNEDHEVVLLEAVNEDALRRTHGRYFVGLKQSMECASGSFLNGVTPPGAAQVPPLPRS